MANKKKLATSVVAVATAATLLLGGTFAWQSISQTALNEASDVINPGGRLHDDFNGTNKDVYVENFADDDIYARVRLDEYFEITVGSGEPQVIAGQIDENGNKVGETHYFTDADKTNEYWTWATGGSTVYVPTFNKNKDSLQADINGTYNSIDDEGNRYADYEAYDLGDVVNGTEIYDADKNDEDEVGTDFANLEKYEGEGAIKTVATSHEAVGTAHAELISMQEWIDDGMQVGDYWVYDEDGWVYYAKPIPSGEATGLLLDEIKLNQVMDDSWYYAINVTAQFITADDLGRGQGTGFYDSNGGPEPSENALVLLKAIGVDTAEKDEAKTFPYNVTLSDPEDGHFLVGTENTLMATYQNDEGAWVELAVKDWALAENHECNCEGNKVDAEKGTLKVDANEEHSFIYLTGTIKEGEYEGYTFESDAYVEYPWLKIVEIDASGEELTDVGGIIPAGETKYYKVKGAIVYSDGTAYPGYENIAYNSSTVTVDVSFEYPFENTGADVYESYWATDDTFVVKHKCNSGSCSCAYPLHIEAVLNSNPNIKGFVNYHIYNSDVISDIHLNVGYAKNHDGEYAYETYEDNDPSNPHIINVYANEDFKFVNFSAGETSTGMFEWTHVNGESIGEGQSIDGVSRLDSGVLELDTSNQISELVMQGNYSDIENVTITLKFIINWQ